MLGFYLGDYNEKNGIIISNNLQWDFKDSPLRIKSIAPSLYLLLPTSSRLLNLICFKLSRLEVALLNFGETFHLLLTCSIFSKVKICLVDQKAAKL